MKIDLFENKYKPSNIAKIFFVDIVCFLLVAFITFGVCYAYLSDRSEVKGEGTTANVGVLYKYDGVEATEVYAKINNSATAKSLTNVKIMPGDKITIVGVAESISNVSVYLLAKLEIKTKQNGQDVTEIVWFNIGSNDPAKDNNGVEIADPDHTPDALIESNYKHLTTVNKITANGSHNIYQVGAGSLGAYKTKNFAIPYTFDGNKYANGDEITEIKFSLHVHQKGYLREASDFYLYSQFEDANKKINGYATESIYASHYMAGTQLKAR